MLLQLRLSLNELLRNSAHIVVDAYLVLQTVETLAILHDLRRYRYLNFTWFVLESDCQGIIDKVLQHKPC